MRERDEGQIIQVGSALAYRGLPLQSAYCASKHAIRGLTESLRSELLHGRSDVTVSTVQPPAMNTPQFERVNPRLPKGLHRSPIYQPEVAADAITHVAETETTELWVGPGAEADVRTIPGNRLSSRLVDYYLVRTGYRSHQNDRVPSDGNDNPREP